MCDHDFSYIGVRYSQGWNNRPGSGATNRYYAHVYMCRKCTDLKGEPIEDRHQSWNSYQDILFGATPGSAEVCGVPQYDRRR
jgi:hypothetical protein